MNNVITSIISRYVHRLFVYMMYLFLYAPLAVLIVFSFNESQFPAPWTGFTLDWYYTLYHTQPIWESLANSLIVATASTGITIVLSIALLLYSLEGGAVSRWLPGFYINLIIPEIVIAVGLLSLFTVLTITPGLMTLVIAHTVLGFAYVLPVVYQRYQDIDYRIIEASLDLGATRAQTFYRIIMPMLTPALVTSGVLAFVISLDDFVLAYFCAGASAQTLPLYILAMLRSGVSPVVNALSTLVLCVSSILVAIYAYIDRRKDV